MFKFTPFNIVTRYKPSGTSTKSGYHIVSNDSFISMISVTLKIPITTYISSRFFPLTSTSIRSFHCVGCNTLMCTVCYIVKDRNILSDLNSIVIHDIFEDLEVLPEDFIPI